MNDITIDQAVAIINERITELNRQYARGELTTRRPIAELKRVRTSILVRSGRH